MYVLLPSLAPLNTPTTSTASVVQALDLSEETLAGGKSWVASVPGPRMDWPLSCVPMWPSAAPHTSPTALYSIWAAVLACSCPGLVSVWAAAPTFCCCWFLVAVCCVCGVLSSPPRCVLGLLALPACAVEPLIVSPCLDRPSLPSLPPLLLMACSLGSQSSLMTSTNATYVCLRYCVR